MASVERLTVQRDFVVRSGVTSPGVDVDPDGAPAIPWVDLMAILQPDHWYRFDQASGDLIDVGFAATGIDLALNGSLAGGFQQPGQIPDETNGAIDFAGITASDFFQTVAPTSGWAASGTLAVLLKMQPAPNTGQWGFTYFAGFDVDEVTLRLVGNPRNGLQYMTSDQIQNDDDFFRTYNNDPDWSESTGFHLAVFVKSADANPPAYYADGGEMGDFTDQIGATSDPGRWLNDFNGDWRIPGRGNPSQLGFTGMVDEFMYWDGVELTQDQVRDMVASAGLTQQADVAAPP